MTAASVAPTSEPTPAPALSFPRIVRGEWIKICTLRSTWWSLAITAALTVGVALLFAQAMRGPADGGIEAAVSSVQFTMLLAGILGAISVTGEYSTGTMRSSLTAVPARGSLLAAKAIVVAALVFAASVVIVVVATFAVSPIVDARDHPIHWHEPSESWLPLLAAAFSMSVFALIGLSLGFVLRSGAGAIAATVGLLFVLPIVVSLLNDVELTWLRVAGSHLPMPASQNLILPQSDWGLEWPVALVTLCAWVAGGLAAAWVTLRSRDA